MRSNTPISTVQDFSMIEAREKEFFQYVIPDNKQKGSGLNTDMLDKRKETLIGVLKLDNTDLA